MPKISVIIPVFNEALCIAGVLNDIFSLRDNDDHPLFYEVIVVDNNSSDGSGEIARAHGATVICEKTPGYGQACWTGVQFSKGEILLFVDGDGSVPIADIFPILNAINDGADLAIGVRNNKHIHSMSIAQVFGNALACFLIRLLWRHPVEDLGPLRAITRSLFNDIKMQDRSFGWTVEMQVKSYRQKANIVNIPISWLARTGGQSKISGTFSGVVLAGIGILSMIATLWWRERKQARITSSTSNNKFSVLPTPQRLDSQTVALSTAQRRVPHENNKTD